MPRGATGPVRQPLLLAAVLLAGCTSPAVTLPDAPETSVAPPAPDVPVARELAFDVLSRNGGPLKVAARAWGPEDAEVAILAVHGSAGGADVSWGPLASTPFTLASTQAAAGRAVVAVDLPGYGGSSAPVGAFGMEDHAFVVDQVADALRAQGHARVVGAGHSMGALIVAIGQSLHESFDAVIVLGWIHGDFGEEALACFNRGECPEDIEIACCFHLPTMDAAVLEEVVAGFEQMPPANGWGIAAWMADGPAGFGPDDVTQRVRVPVLAVNGDPDWFYDEADYEAEPSQWPAARVENVILPETGHFVLHHRGHEDVLRRIDAWVTSVAG